MRFLTKSIAFAIACMGSFFQFAVAQTVAPNPQRALLDKYCVICHNDRAKTGGLTLEKLDMANIPANAETWEMVIRKLGVGAMPPSGMPKPSVHGRQCASIILRDVARQGLRRESESRPCDAAPSEPHRIFELRARSVIAGCGRIHAACRLMTKVMVSITMPTCSACRPSLLERYYRRRAR